MVCDVCSKNQATVHLTEIIDDSMKELHLCEECARQKSAQMDQQFGLADLLAGLAEFGKPQGEDKNTLNMKCPNCGLAFKDFKKIGRLGCSECYTSFRRYLGPLLKRIHGANKHIGKSPAKITGDLKERIDIEDLRNKLQDAVEAEKFEEAAKLRDQIKELEIKAKVSPIDNKEGKE
ncbi:MAG: UvrB/UvrC motif-containing protein [Candidatus Omnitrophota bacterium]|nr:UvrB/UvrC motif-containing protein [Candidatus Omnitrophota bacterium]MBU1928611.1 UvrB/UvrC motif-containing protein [Candidatus Omnitrophota bacterium]MBU2034624.1 UvrB/UvrC motif-containing protein [Candidatus Omnitrophota bacterium]MBU2257684.1 UvrB/UvrC motif-containing protein [Candidatus Omnitrophota bacterium]